MSVALLSLEGQHDDEELSTITPINYLFIDLFIYQGVFPKLILCNPAGKH